MVAFEIFPHEYAVCAHQCPLTSSSSSGQRLFTSAPKIPTASWSPKALPCAGGGPDKSSLRRNGHLAGEWGCVREAGGEGSDRRRQVDTSNQGQKRNSPPPYPCGAPVRKASKRFPPQSTTMQCYCAVVLRFVATGRQAASRSFRNPDARTRLEMSIAREGNAPRRSHPPSPRQVKKDVFGAGSAPGGTASPWGVGNVKPVPVPVTRDPREGVEGEMGEICARMRAGVSFPSSKTCKGFFAGGSSRGWAESCHSCPLTRYSVPITLENGVGKVSPSDALVDRVVHGSHGGTFPGPRTRSKRVCHSQPTSPRKWYNPRRVSRDSRQLRK